MMALFSYIIARIVTRRHLVLQLHKANKGTKKLCLRVNVLRSWMKFGSLGSSLEQSMTFRGINTWGNISVYLILSVLNFELDRRTRTPKCNWTRCKKNWQLMS
ncbi:uncharacterized protein LOC117626480 [Prunus dulcis]|uniref:uncharacterized protein LOC117626480 n=1 Tax=Prunus dulcis TaxID=3755 RepID=UPI001482AC5D|nr:uncharacterized protein LOC117626480 [Prunus dulcis]